MQQAIHTEESVKDYNEASFQDCETDLANVKKQLDFTDAKTPTSVVGDQQVDHKQLLKDKGYYNDELRKLNAFNDPSGLTVD